MANNDEDLLVEAALDALFNYQQHIQKHLLDANDEDWRSVYRMRIELGNLITRRNWKK